MPRNWLLILWPSSMTTLKAALAVRISAMSRSSGSDVNPLPWKPATCVSCQSLLSPAAQDLGWRGPPIFSCLPWREHGAVTSYLQPSTQDGRHSGEGRLKQQLSVGQSRAGRPWLWERQEISALVFVPGMISPLAHWKPGLGASDLSWDGQTGQWGLGLVTRQEALDVLIRASACRAYSSRDCFMAVIPEKGFRAAEGDAR